MTCEEEILKAHILKLDRSWIITHPEHELSATEQKKYDALLHRFQNSEPLPYILGYKEFYGRKFTVNKHTLIPRPESELIIDIVKNISKKMKHPLIIDVGTGSGCLAITTSLEIPHANVVATDISEKAIEIAKENATRLQTNLHFYSGNLLEPINTLPSKSTESLVSQKDIIVMANLPYIPTDEWKTLEPHVKKHEPQTALDGGRDGLDFYRELFTQIPNKKFHILCEIMPDQGEAFSNIIPSDTHMTIHKDLAGHDRIAHLITCSP